MNHTYIGTPCKKAGHTERYVSGRTCVECGRLRSNTREFRWRRSGAQAPTRPRPHLCECCGKPEVVKDHRGRIKPLSLDHCHKTKKFRGWLCFNCNSSIGKLGDSVESILKVLEYLWGNRWTSRPVNISSPNGKKQPGSKWKRRNIKRFTCET